MTSETEAKITELLAQLQHIERISPSDIPDIGLYMDQITSFMDARLQNTRRSESDKVLTKTMINNYTKHKLLPPPDKKKYSRDHLLVLLLIYYSKEILSLQDIRSLLTPLTQNFFQNQGGITLSEIYESIFQLMDKELPELQEDILRNSRHARASFPEADGEEQDFLQFFLLISSLCMDVYIKKKVIEQLIDSFNSDRKS